MSQRALARKPANASTERRHASSGLKVNRRGDTFEQEAGVRGMVARSPRVVQRVTANPSAAPKSIHCHTDQGPKGASATSLTGVKLGSGLNADQKKQVAEFFKKWKDGGAKDFIAVEGYASADTANDSEAQQAANWTNSRTRAEAVQRELVRLGVPATLILTWGHGETDRFSPFGKDPDPNRRVELSMVTMQKTGTASTAGPTADAPRSIQVKGQADDKKAQVDVKASRRMPSRQTRPHRIKLESTPFAKRFPGLKGVKVGGYGGFGFEQGVEIPGVGEEKRARVFTLGGYIGFDHDFDFSGK